MLTEGEFEKIEAYVSKHGLGTGNGKSKIVDLMDYIQSHFVLSVSSIGKTPIKNCVGPTMTRTRDESSLNETEKREQSIGFKVRTSAEGERADEFRKNL